MLMAEYFWQMDAITWGLLPPLPFDFSTPPSNIPRPALALQNDLPTEWELLAQFLQGQH